MLNKRIISHIMIATFLVTFSFNAYSYVNFYDKEDIDWQSYHPSIAVFGDSISTGVFADTSIGKFPLKLLGKSAEESVKAFDVLFKKGSDEFTETILNKAVHRLDLTAYGSLEAWSIRSKIAELNDSVAKPADVKVYNVSHVGHRVSNLEGQVTKMNTDHYQKLAKKPGHVFVLIGSNDFCGGKTTEEFKEKLNKNLKLILAAHDKSVVTVGYLPPVDMLASDSNNPLEIGVKIPRITMEKKTIKVDFTVTVPEIYDGYKVRKKKKTIKKDKVVEVPVVHTKKVVCREMRERYCERMFEPEAGDIVAAFNHAISETVELMQAEFKQHRLFVATKINEMPTDKQNFAADCFHPSAKGQEVISEGFLEHYL